MIQADDRLTGIEIAGFKSAAQPVRINLKDITVLAGANSAGKSTVIQPLLLLKQTIEKPFDAGPLAIDGPLVRFTATDQFFSRQKGQEKSHTFKTTYHYDENYIALDYGRGGHRGIEIRKMLFNDGADVFEWVEGNILDDGQVRKLATSTWGARDTSTFTRYLNKTQGKLRVARQRATLVAGVSDGRSPSSSDVIAYFRPATKIIEDAADLIHLPGLRGNPERSYPISASNRFPGSFNDYVASIIHQWAVSKDPRAKSLEDALKTLGLTWRVTTKMIDDTKVEVRVGRLPNATRGGARDTVNIADVGFGVSQTLPVLVALLSAEKGQMVFIEQPEIHLHPKAQVAMAGLFVQAALRGVRLIVETHSSLLILALQAAVAEQKIGADKISMNWFSRDADGQTHVVEAELGPDGSYGEWPVDFDEVQLGLEDRYLTSAEERHGG